jgi:hypothetical protein
VSSVNKNEIEAVSKPLGQYIAGRKPRFRATPSANPDNVAIAIISSKAGAHMMSYKNQHRVFVPCKYRFVVHENPSFKKHYKLPVQHEVKQQEVKKL